MTTVVERRNANPGALVSICDFSPPRGPDPALLEPARQLGADFLSIAYHPGKSTTANSAFTALSIQEQSGRDVVFTLATRDMNQLALQSLLLGAALVGLENVVVVQGDRFTERERARVRSVDEVTPSDLVRAIGLLNEGRDYRDRELPARTKFCIGATIDLGSGSAREPALARRKVEAGAQFFLVQPLFSPEPLLEFRERYEQTYGDSLEAPLFGGLQVLTAEGLSFGDVPTAIAAELERGRPGAELALEVADRFLERGLRSFYVVPPILRGGGRDYPTTARVLDELHARVP